MTKSSVSARELLAVREDLLLDLKGDLRLDLDAAASLDDFLDDTKWAKLESTDTEVRIRFWNVKEKNCRKYAVQEIKIHVSWEGHKILRNLHLLLSVCTVDKSKVEISQNFVTFSEYTNFKQLPFLTKYNLDVSEV